MKENDNIEIPQRGRPKKNNADSSYSYTKILETDKTYNYNNQIFENQYELEQCEPFIKPFSETQGFDGPRTYDPRMHESLYEQEYENTNDSYMYAQRPYENVEQEQYLHMDPDIHNRNVPRPYENLEEQYGHIDPRSQNDNTQRPFDDIEQKQYMHMDPRMQNGPRQYESIEQQYMHVDPGLQHDSTQRPYENTEEQQYMHMDPRLQIDSTQRPYENIEQRQYIDPGLPKTNQQRQVNFYAENPSNYRDYNKLEGSDSSFKNNRSIFKSPASQNYSTIDIFEDDRIINKRKEQKNIYSYADHFMNAGWMNRKKRKNNPFIWQYLKNTEHPQIIPPSEYSSVDYVNSLDKSGQKMYLGTMKRPSYVEKAVSNNTILPLFLNNSNYYETSTSKQEFEKIAKAFMSKTEGLNYENVTVQQLKILMKEFGLSHTGKKQELIERVKQTANLIYDKIRNKGGVVDMDSKPANKKEYDVKPASGMDNETQGFDYLFF